MIYSECTTFALSLTTQGPTYPPSEIMDEHGDFVVIGRINRINKGLVSSEWGAAIVSPQSKIPLFGKQAPYIIKNEFCVEKLDDLADKVLYTLPLPLPCNNYHMIFAPDQNPAANKVARESLPLHQAFIPDFKEEYGRKINAPITLGDWVKAKGECTVGISMDRKCACFEFNFTGLIPDSLYTVMALRENDLNPKKLTRPGPLGVPNVFITDKKGSANYVATLPNPFPVTESHNRNRIVNVIVLWMSSQCNYGGAIGLYGLGGDIHAHLKLKNPSFYEFTTL